MESIVKWKNNYYSVKNILKIHPIPNHWKYDKDGNVINNYKRKWCKKIIRLAGKELRRLANMSE
jgi:hypothetical protein